MSIMMVKNTNDKTLKTISRLTYLRGRNLFITISSNNLNHIATSRWIKFLEHRPTIRNHHPAPSPLIYETHIFLWVLRCILVDVFASLPFANYSISPKIPKNLENVGNYYFIHFFYIFGEGGQALAFTLYWLFLIVTKS